MIQFCSFFLYQAKLPEVSYAELQKIVRFLGTVTLEETDAAIVSKAGIREFRYVCWRYRHHWMVTLKLYNKTENSSQIPEDQNCSQEDDGSLIETVKHRQPRMWIDLNGNSIQSVFEGSLQTILEIIVQKPGIYEVG